MRTDRKQTAGAPATKAAAKPAAMPAQLGTHTPKSTAPLAAVASGIQPVVTPLPLGPKPAVPLAPATFGTTPNVASLAPAPLSGPGQPRATAAQAVSPADRGRLIATEAFLLAEKNNFEGDPADYWRRAEAIVAANLGRSDEPARHVEHGESLGNREGRHT